MPITNSELYQLRTDNDKYYLLIQNAIGDVAGAYVINASNSAGQVSTTIDLNVTGKKSLFEHETNTADCMCVACHVKV
jgi:acyl-coenzyme A thioesterase PaaI-like protein